jgi:four helix bundle protein
MAKGSLAEVQTRLEIAFEIGYLDGVNFRQMDEKCSTMTYYL